MSSRGIADTSVGIITINEDDDIPNRATIIPDASALRPKPNSVKSEFWFKNYITYFIFIFYYHTIGTKREEERDREMDR